MFDVIVLELSQEGKLVGAHRRVLSGKTTTDEVFALFTDDYEFFSILSISRRPK